MCGGYSINNRYFLLLMEYPPHVDVSLSENIHYYSLL